MRSMLENTSLTRTLPTIGATVLSAVFALGTASAQTAPHTGLECQDVTVTRLQTIEDTITAAIAQARTDVAENGATGRYASAPHTNLKMLLRARDGYLPDQTDGTSEMIAFLNSSGGTAGGATYSQAGQLSGGTRAVIDYLLLADHWSRISAVYHDSEAAYQSLELSSQAADELLALRLSAARCYVDAYLR